MAAPCFYELLALAMTVLWLLSGLVVYFKIHERRTTDRVHRRTAPSTPDSILCHSAVQAGWGRIENVRQRPSGITGGPAWYSGDLDCMTSRSRTKYDVVREGAWPLDDCPERASRESLMETQIAIDAICGAAKIEAPLAALNLVRRPNGTPLMVRGEDILRSVLVGPDGHLVIMDGFAIHHRTGRLWDHVGPFAVDLHVVWTERSPDGSILFSSVPSALFNPRAPILTRWTSRVPHGDTRPVPDMPDAQLELRSIGHVFKDSGPWEVSLIRREPPSIQTYQAEYGPWISMVTHPPTPIVPDTNPTEEPDVCMICHSELTGREPLARLRRCGHTLHEPCIRQWLNQPGMRRICPKCQTEVRLTPPRPSPWWERNR